MTIETDDAAQYSLRALDTFVYLSQQRLTDIIEDAKSAISNGEYKIEKNELLKQKYLLRHLDDPILTEILTKSFDSFSDQINDVTSYQGQLLSNTDKIKNILTNLKQVAGPADFALDVLDINEAADSGDPVQLGEATMKAMAGFIYGSLVSAASAAVVGAAAVSLPAAALAAVAVAVGALIIDRVIDDTNIISDIHKEALGLVMYDVFSVLEDYLGFQFIDAEHPYDVAAVEGLLYTIDYSLTDVDLKWIMNCATRDKTHSLEAIVNMIGELLSVGTEVALHDRVGLSNRISAIQETILVSQDGYDLLDPYKNLEISRLTDQGKSFSGATGTNDYAIAYRYALVNLNHFAIIGNPDLYAPYNTAGELDLFDSSNNTGILTLAYLEDRAKLLEMIVSINRTNSSAYISDRKIEFIDKETNSVYVTHTTDNRQVSERIVFGSAENDLLDQGGSQWDHLYGGDGNDTLQGGGGNDYLEGGKGEDIYVVNTGEGRDTIFDIDGQGSIRYNGIDLGADIYWAGTNVWKYGDDVYFVLRETTDNGNTLYINQDIEIKNFNNGDLGIHLPDQTPLPDSPDTYVPTPYEFDQNPDLWNTFTTVSTSDPSNWIGTNMEDYISPGFDLVIDRWRNEHNESIGYGRSDIYYEYEQFGEYYVTTIPSLSDTNLTIEGKDGNDHIRGYYYDDLILGGQGNDFINGDMGDDVLYGGIGDDMIFTGYGNDLAYGGEGNDTITSANFSRWWLELVGDVYWGAFWGLAGRYFHVERDPDPLPMGSDDERLNFTYTYKFSDTIIGGPYVDHYINASHRAFVPTPESRTNYGTLYLDVEYVDNYPILGDPPPFSYTDVYLAIESNTLTKYELSTEFEGTGFAFDRDAPKYIDGGNGDDLLGGDTGDDTILGGNGDDHLQGNEGNDLLSGGNDSDYIIGGAGNDTLNGGDGIDTLVGEDGDDALFGGNGNDELIGDSPYMDPTLHGNDMLDGEEGDDELWGYGGNDILYGGDGNDNLIGGDGGDELYGGEGNNNYWGDNGNDILVGGTGTDIMAGGEGNDYISGGAGDDTMDGQAGDDTYLLLAGDGLNGDWIPDTEGYNTIVFGPNINETDIKVWFDDDKDTVIQYSENDTVTIKDGTSGSISNFEFSDGSSLSYGEIFKYSVESIYYVGGTSSQDDYWGGIESDVIALGDGDDTIYGGGGNDNIFGYNSNFRRNTITSDNDTLYGEDGDDFLNGGYGIDTLHGGTGNDKIQGNPGDDILIGGAGDDILLGDQGSDTYYFNTGDGTDIIFDDASRIENNYWYTYYGNNTDTIIFGEGILPDSVTVSRENNCLVLRTNGTDDTIIVSTEEVSLYPNVTVFPTYENWNWNSGGLYSIEQIAFSETGDTWDTSQYQLLVNLIEGTDENDRLWGDDSVDAGGDEIYGGLGNDIIYGQANDDFLFGGEGFDDISGDEGDDTLVGGHGNDTLRDRSGNDTYMFSVGDGQDAIDDRDGNSDSIIFGPGIQSQDLRVQRIDDSLRIHLWSDSIEIANWYTTVYNGHTEEYGIIEKFSFFDDTYLTAADIEFLAASAITNNAPNLIDSIADQNALNGAPFSFTIPDAVFSDADTNDTLVLSATLTNGDPLPDWLNFNPVTGVFSGTPGNSDTSLEIRITATDNWGDSTYDDFLIDISKTIVTGTASDDELTGTPYNDEIHGGSGHDLVKGDLGDDIINGGDGDDRLYGGAGGDLLIGSNGSDILSGDAGDDTYRFSAYISGEQRIMDDSRDRVELIGIDPADIVVERGEWYIDGDEGPNPPSIWAGGDGLSLGLIYYPTGIQSDRLVVGIDNFFNYDGSSRGVSSIVFDVDGDGNYDTEWTFEDVKALFTTSTEGDDVIQLFSSDDVAYGGGGNDYILGGGGEDYLHGGKGDDIIKVNPIQFNELWNETWLFGDDGDDTLSGGKLADYLSGGEDNDTLDGNAGDDTLDGGAGDDSLNGGGGNDYYLYSGGNDMINDNGSHYSMGGGNDTVRLEGLKFSELSFSRSGTQSIYSGTAGSNLIITITSSGEQLLITNYFLNDSTSDRYFIETIEVLTEDGTGYRTLDFSEIFLATQTPTGGNDSIELGPENNDGFYSLAGNDFILAGAGDDRIFGDDGDDTLGGGAGNDILVGGTGNDLLYGDTPSSWPFDEGDDTLVGGPNNDIMYGLAGNDHYVFTADWGQDLINDMQGAEDKLILPGLNPADIMFEQIGSNLRVNVLASGGGYVDIDRWYSGSTWQLETFEANGSSLQNTDVESLIQAMASFASDRGLDGWQDALLSSAYGDDAASLVASHWSN